MQSLSRSKSKITTLAASPDRSVQALAKLTAKTSVPSSKDAKAGERNRPRAATVSWYGSLLIISTLLVAAGWELFRLVLAIVVMD